ncbi:MAG: hypothetical protein IID15_08495, partial [Candidatus Marinimicrobia bacterium]|nr:hypothetical protein [Candidatus Neomarinimicrobiota bacterium]
MIQINLTWQQCEERWCVLNDLNLNDEQFELLTGVYVIWRQRSSSREIMRVGQGYLKQRLHLHRWEPDIMSVPKSEVCVTWASLDASHRDGAVRYLAETLHPAMPLDPLPAVDPLSVS